MAAFDTNLALDAFLEFQTGPTADRFYSRLSQSQPDLAAALRVMAMGDSASKIVAQRWLKGDKLGAAELRTVGISQRINSTQQATTLLSIIVSLLADAAKVRGLYSNRVVWLVDEFQRAKKAGSAVLTDVNAGMHSLFNATPDNLSIVFSFSGSPAASLPAWFSRELKDRIGLTKAFVLPPLQKAEAMPFVRDVLQHYRINGISTKNELFPFTKDACSEIFAQIESTGELRPRAIMNAFHVVLAAADEEIERGRMVEIDSAFARKALDEHINVAPTEEEEQ